MKIDIKGIIITFVFYVLVANITSYLIEDKLLLSVVNLAMGGLYILWLKA